MCTGATATAFTKGLLWLLQAVAAYTHAAAVAPHQAGHYKVYAGSTLRHAADEEDDIGRATQLAQHGMPHHWPLLRVVVLDSDVLAVSVQNCVVGRSVPL